MQNHLREAWAARIALSAVQVRQGTPLDYPYFGTPQRFYVSKPAAGVGKHPYFTEDGLVAFLDAFVSKDRVFIAYMNVRKDYRGRGYARQLVQEVYNRFPDRLIDWGRLMEPEVEHLFEDFKQRFPTRTKGRWT